MDSAARDFPLIQEVVAKMACRSKVPPRKRANEETRVNSITVGTFCPSTPVVKVPVNPGVSTVRTLKIAVAERLKLYCGSHNIFGLYLGVKLLSSFKILQDDDIMTPNMLGDGTKKYYFQHVALDFSKESSVIECVEMVTEILYCEVKEMYNRKLIWPLPTDEQAKEIKQLIEQAGSDPKKQVEFFKYIREELRKFYWNHYHRVDNCVLQSKVTAAEPRAQEGSIVSVSVNFATLIITYIGDEGKPFEFIFNWDKVRSLDLDNGKYCVIFEVRIENVPGERYKNILRAISIHCDQYEYIFPSQNTY